MPGDSLGVFLSVILNVYYHRKHEYILLRGGNLSVFRDIKPFMRCNLLE